VRSEISRTEYNKFPVRCADHGTVPSLGSWISALAGSYPVGFEPIFSHRLMWAERLVVPDMGRAEWDYSRDGTGGWPVGAMPPPPFS
jgi:hypothetical protein